MLEISEEQGQWLRSILDQHLRGAEVRAFGSRVSDKAKSYSDLDLMVRADQPVDIRTMGRLREALQASPLPFRVELVDWHRCSKNFQDIMAENNQLVWPLA